MQEKPPGSLRAHSQGIKLGDIYYIIFRHKWKILIVSALGLIAAAVVNATWPPMYEGEATLLVKYVQDTTPPDNRNEPDTMTHTPVGTGESILATELEIIRNQNVADTVADNLSHDILEKIAKGTNHMAAAAYINAHLQADVPRATSVIRLTFDHPDPSVIQPVLTNVIEAYTKIHAYIHGHGQFDDIISEERNKRKSLMDQASDAFRTAKANADVLDVQDTKKTLSDARTKTEQDLFDTQTELAQKIAYVKDLTGTNTPGPVQPGVGTNADLPVKLAPVPDEVLAEYKDVLRDIDTVTRLRDKKIEEGFLPTSALVKKFSDDLAGYEARRHQMETNFPGLPKRKSSLAAAAPTLGANGSQATSQENLVQEIAQIRGLVERMSSLSNRLARIKSDEDRFATNEPAITQFEREVARTSESYLEFQKRLDQMNIEQDLGSGKAANISPIESPTPPYGSAENRKKKVKAVGMILAGSVGGILGLVFLLEVYLDQTIRRPVEVESKLGLPVFINIPLLGMNGSARRLTEGVKVPLLPPPSGSTNGNGSNGAVVHASEPSTSHAHDVEVALWDSRHELHPYCEALRDRLINFFEIKNLTHKPKLVSVTGCEDGSGVSSIAAGLAASLSETGDGNVLLVDMNNQGTAQQFYRGDLACGLDDALESEKRGGAMVQDNLYVVTGSTNNDKLPRALPKRFKHLVPRLRASDFDYIIFDMPPVSQTSVTLQLARFMDSVLVVAESERTDREKLRKAAALLEESKTNVGVVLNKGRNYVPERLRQDI